MNIEDLDSGLFNTVHLSTSRKYNVQRRIVIFPNISAKIKLEAKIKIKKPLYQ